jgi:ubiquinone/menaquinone biosynthesis C-methylase UbiE
MNMDFRKRITERYDSESQQCSSLGCGDPLAHLALRPGETIIDIGCGNGNEMIRASHEVGTDGHVMGIDLSPRMLIEARRSARNQGLGNCRFIYASADRIPLRAGIADAVMSNCSINHAPDKWLVFSEIYRVLRPAGRLVVSDIYSSEALPDNIRNDPDMWAQCLGGAITRKEYLGAMTSAGFTDIRVVNEETSRKKARFGIFTFTVVARK